MGIGDNRAGQETISPLGSKGSFNQILTIRPDIRDGVRYYCCPYCKNIQFETAFKLRKHINSEHSTKRTLVLDHPKLDVDYTDLRLIEEDSAVVPEAMKEFSQNESGKRKAEPTGQPLLASRGRKRQKRVIFDPSDSGGGQRRNQRYEEPISEEDEDSLVHANEDDGDDFMDGSEAGHDASVEPRLDHCDVCCLEVKAGLAGHIDQLEVAGQSYRELISTVLGTDIDDDCKTVCQDCDNLTSSIAQTRLQLIQLQKNLNDSVSQLRDLYQRGRSLLEADLEDGGLATSSVFVRIVQEFSQPQREAKNLGFTIGQSYHGQIVSEQSSRDDDGSQVRMLNREEDEQLETQGYKNLELNQISLFLTQEEWASSGLTVWDGKVQVPEGLVAGVALSASGPRFLLSQGVCTDLGDHCFICLHCDNTFDRIYQLLNHLEKHNPESEIAQDHLEVFLSEAEGGEDLLSGQAADVDPGRERLSVKLARASKMDQQATEQDVRGSRRQFRAFMHKAQFKECENEVATLDKPFQCTQCNKCFESAQELWGHQISFGTQTFDCNFGSCKEEFERLSDFAVHYASHIGEVLEIPKDAGGKKTMCIPCPVCGIVVYGLYKLQRHKMKHDAELKYKCPACPKQFVKANTMRRHIKSIHKGEKYQLKCHLCQFKVSSREGLAQHLRSAHDIQSIKEEPSMVHLTCLKCGLVCSTVEELRLHETGHLTLPTSRIAHIGSRIIGKVDGAGNIVTRLHPRGQQTAAVGVTRISSDHQITAVTRIGTSGQQLVTGGEVARISADNLIPTADGIARISRGSRQLTTSGIIARISPSSGQQLVTADGITRISSGQFAAVQPQSVTRTGSGEQLLTAGVSRIGSGEQLLTAGVSRIGSAEQLLTAGVSRIGTSLLVRNQPTSGQLYPIEAAAVEGDRQAVEQLTDVHLMEREYTADRDDDTDDSQLDTSVSNRRCPGCEEILPESAYLTHVLEVEKTGLCTGVHPDSRVCPECVQVIREGQSISEHMRQNHDSEADKFQCSECEIRLLSLQGCRRHYRREHRGTPITCILCKETFSSDSVFHDHLTSQHQHILAPAYNSTEPIQCRYCDGVFSLFMELVIHVRFNHLLETIDIGSTELEEVTMIGGHVVEFSEDGGQIVALHTIP